MFAKMQKVHTKQTVHIKCPNEFDLIMTYSFIHLKLYWLRGIPSWTVPAPQVSVSPYPWPTGQQKQMFMKRWVSADRGAPPDSIMRILPPSSFRTFLKIILYAEYSKAYIVQTSYDTLSQPVS